MAPERAAPSKLNPQGEKCRLTCRSGPLDDTTKIATVLLAFLDGNDQCQGSSIMLLLQQQSRLKKWPALLTFSYYLIVSCQVFFQVIFSLDYFSKLFYCMTPQILRQTNPYKSSKFSECLKNASNNEIKIVLCKIPKRYHLEDYAFQNRIGLLDCSFSEPTKLTQDNEISK